jgi:hypothetical protein
MLGAFTVANVAAFGLSLVRPCYDCVNHIGWPFIFFEEGGIRWQRTFNLTALCGDIAIALVVSLLWAFAHEERQTIFRLGRVGGRYLIREIRASWEDFRRKLR